MNVTIDETGIYNGVPEDVYHSDPCPAPSLSSGIIKTLIGQSPYHAWFRHPRLNPNYVSEEKESFDLGSAAHSLILEGDASACVLDFPDWRSKAARDARDAARSMGKTPVLAGKWAAVQELADEVQRKCAQLDPVPFVKGKGAPEQTLVWQEENGVWCRVRLDWLHFQEAWIDDLKTTALSANPEVWGRSAFGFGADIQAAFYRRGYEKVFGGKPVFRFVVVENTAPYGVSTVEFSSSALALADRKIELAIRLWGECLASNSWPGYSTRTAVVDAPAWMETSWMEREIREEMEVAA